MTRPDTANSATNVRDSKVAEAKSMPARDVVSSIEPTHDAIRRRAYEIFLSRNGRPGDPTADWLQAERELKAEQAVSKSTPPSTKTARKA